MIKPSIWLVIPCAGSGSRFGGDIPKQYLPLLDKTVFQQTLSRFSSRPDIKGIVIAHAVGDVWLESFPEIQEDCIYCVEGGRERSESVFNAIKFIRQQMDCYVEGDLIAVHDAARPCVSREDLDHVFTMANKVDSGAILAAPIVDTVKSLHEPAVSGRGCIAKTLDRNMAVLALTPQVFNGECLYTALKVANEQRLIITDEASAIELLGLKVTVVLGQRANIKITCPEDLSLAEFHLAKLLEQEK